MRKNFLSEKSRGIIYKNKFFIYAMQYYGFREEWRRWYGLIRCRPSSCLQEFYLHVLKRL